jgi:5-methylcytosine-specific restriction protein A
MAIPQSLTRAHVLQAIARLEEDGVPANADSTKFDLVDSNGNRWPPKAVMEIAVELATGRPFPRGDFSGGDETNSKLEELGFEIKVKAGLHKSKLRIEEIQPGMAINNDDLVQAFAVGNAGGMRWSGKHTRLVIIVDHTKSLYDDRWDGDVLRYTGMGKAGDQALSGQNLRLAEQPKTGTDVHLFEVFEQNNYVYAGRVALSGEVTTEPQPDEDGKTRNVFVFPLKLVTGHQPQPTLQQVERLRENRQRQLEKKSLAELKALATAKGKQKSGRRDVKATQYERNEAVAEYVKRVAKGICGLCEEPAPFEAAGAPYLESHHVVHLAKGGPDSIGNAIALCPNCHRKMHVLDRKQDRTILLTRIAQRER